MAKNNINLMPEDLRHKEQEAVSKAPRVEAQPDLSQPKEAQLQTKPEASGGHGPSFSGAKPQKKEQEPKQPIVNNRQNNRYQSLANNKKVDKIPPVPAKNKKGFELEKPKTETATKFHKPEKRIRARFVQEGGGVDLVPTAAKIRTWKQLSTLIIISFIASLGVIAVFYFGLLTWSQSLSGNRTATIKQISDIEQQLLNFADINKEINELGQEINLVYNAINKHIYWTNFFELLEKYTVEDVYYSNFSAGTNGALTLDATGPDYMSVAKQLKVLQQPAAQEFVTDVIISSAAAIQGGVSFSVTLVLNPDLFYYQTDN